MVCRAVEQSSLLGDCSQPDQNWFVIAIKSKSLYGAIAWLDIAKRRSVWNLFAVAACECLRFGILRQNPSYELSLQKVPCLNVKPRQLHHRRIGGLQQQAANSKFSPKCRPNAEIANFYWKWKIYIKKIICWYSAPIVDHAEQLEFKYCQYEIKKYTIGLREWFNLWLKTISW